MGRKRLGSTRAFLRWARSERLTVVALGVTRWDGPADRIDHDRRWQQVRRLLHDDTLPTEDRIAGLLITLHAQTATSTSTLRFDQIQITSSGARITFGSTPIDLRPALAALIDRLSTDREGTDRAGTLWLLPGRPWSHPSALPCCATGYPQPA